MIGNVFPSIVYDGGLVTSSISSTTDDPSKYEVGETVFIQDKLNFDIFQGTVIMPPTKQTNLYTIEMENGTEEDVKPENVFNEHNVPASGKPSVSLGFFAPDWLKQDQPVTLLHKNTHKRINRYTFYK